MSTVSGHAASLRATDPDRGVVPAVDTDALIPAAFRRGIEEQLRPATAAQCGVRLDAAFRACVQRHPERPAVLFDGGHWRYDELSARAAGVAAHLRRLGIGRNQVVAVALDKGPAQVAAVLGILRSGAAYAPLDPTHPPQRLAELMSSLDARAVMLDESRRDAPWRGDTSAVLVADAADTSDAPDDEVDHASPDDLAYLIHTSGASDRPMGVMINHAAAWATIAAVNERLALEPQDRVLSVSALTCDRSVWDIFGPLSVGAAVVMPDAAGARDPAAWLALSGRAGVTVWNSAPRLMTEVLAHAGQGLRGLRWALLSGGSIPLSMPEAIRAIARACRVLSLGGATEAAVWSVWHEVGQVLPEWRSIPYGRPLPGQQAFVVDARLRLCPAWVEGEIVLAGCGLAQGYWRNSEDTAARFVSHPRTGQRLYRTGDRGRFRADGIIEPVATTSKSGAEPSAFGSVDAEVAATIRAFLIARLNLPELLPGDRLISLGADSMVLLDLAAQVEHRHARQLHIPTLFSNPTVEEIVTLARK